MANMLKTHLLYVILTCACVCLLGPAGCSAKKEVSVSGKLVLPADLERAENDGITIQFVPQDKSDTSVQSVRSGASSRDLTIAPTAIYPGKYKIAVAFQPYPGPEQAKRTALLAPVNKAFEAANTPLTYEVTLDKDQSITIDLAQKSVTKK
jgi:hypothetical protein